MSGCHTPCISVFLSLFLVSSPSLGSVNRYVTESVCKRARTLLASSAGRVSGFRPSVHSGRLSTLGKSPPYSPSPPLPPATGTRYASSAPRSRAQANVGGEGEV